MERFQRQELLYRRIRLISDIAEDYQENMRRIFRLIEMDSSLFELPATATAAAAPVAESNTTENRQTRGSHNLFSDNYPLSQSPLLRTFAFLTRPSNQPIGSSSSSSGYTNDDIAQVTTIVQYDPSMNQTQCPISWDNFTPGQEVMRINGCGHMFCSNALIEWFGGHRRCPVCRSLPLRFSWNTTENHDISNDRPLTYEDESSPLNNVSLRDPMHLQALARRFGLSPEPEDPLRITINGFVSNGPQASEFLSNFDEGGSDSHASDRPSEHRSFEYLPSGNGDENVLYERTDYAQRSNQPINSLGAGSTIVNSILDGLVEGLQNALHTDSSTNNTSVFEREYTLNLADLLALPSRRSGSPHL